MIMMLMLYDFVDLCMCMIFRIMILDGLKVLSTNLMPGIPTIQNTS